MSMKKCLVPIMIIVLMGLTFVWADETPTELPNVKIIINSEQKLFTDMPISVNGRTLLPLRQCLVYLGVPDDSRHIIWNQSDKSVTVKHGDREIYIKVNDSKARINGTEIILPAASTIYKGHTYIPARFIAEALSKKVTWDAKYMAVYIADEEVYNRVKTVMGKVLTEAKALKDTSYTINYDLNVKLEGDIPKGISQTSEGFAGSDTVECDFSSGVTHFTLGESKGLAPVEPAMPLVEEGYYAKDFSYIKYKGYRWSKSAFDEGAAFSYSTETGSRIPRESKIVLDSLDGIVGDIQYAGLKIDSALSSGNETVLKGDLYSDFVIYKILSIIPNGKLGAQATMAMLFGGEVKNASFKTVITIDTKNNTLNKIEFEPNVLYMVGTGKTALSVTLSGKITNEYISYNKGLNLKVPDEIVKNAASGLLAEDIPASELITGRSASVDYEKIKDLGTLDEVIGVLGQGKKTASETAVYYIWGDAGSGVCIEVAFKDGKVQSHGCMGNYQEAKYQKIKLGMSMEEVVGILGEGKKSRTEVTDIYEWKYSDGTTIQVWAIDNKVIGCSEF